MATVLGKGCHEIFVATQAQPVGEFVEGEKIVLGVYFLGAGLCCRGVTGGVIPGVAGLVTRAVTNLKGLKGLKGLEYLKKLNRDNLTCAVHTAPIN